MANAVALCRSGFVAFGVTPLVEALRKPTNRQFTIQQLMIVIAVFAVLFWVVPVGLALVVSFALFIPLVTDLASRPKPRNYCAGLSERDREQ
jgi:hypothetical protein